MKSVFFGPDFVGLLLGTDSSFKYWLIWCFIGNELEQILFGKWNNVKIWLLFRSNRLLKREKMIQSKAVVSNQILFVATFATIVATKVFLSSLLSEFKRYCSLFIIRNTFSSNCLSPHSNLLLPESQIRPLVKGQTLVRLNIIRRGKVRPSQG